MTAYTNPDNLPFPDDYQQPADSPSAFRSLAEATQAALTNLKAYALARVTQNWGSNQDVAVSQNTVTNWKNAIEARLISAGTGLTGGGSLAASRTLSADMNVLAAKSHTHDYSPSSHNHSGTYAPVSHEHAPVMISGAHMVHPGYQTVTAVEPAWTPYWPGVKFAMPAGVRGWVRATVAGYTDVQGGTSSPQGALFGLDLGLWGETAGDGSSAWSNGNATALGRLTAPPGEQIRTSYIASGWRYHSGNGDMFVVPLGQALGSLVSGGHVKFGLCRVTLEFYPGSGGEISAATF